MFAMGGRSIVLQRACVWEGFMLSNDGKAPWVQLPSKFLVTLARDGANSYYEGIELEARWIFQ